MEVLAAGRAAGRAEAEPAQDFLDVLERLALARATLSVEPKRRIPAFLDMTERAGRPQPTLELWIFEAEQE